MENQTRFDLSQQLAKWRNALLASKAMDPDCIRELENHLHEAMTELRAKGLSEEAAFWSAARALGETSALAAQFEIERSAAAERQRAMLKDLVRELPRAVGVFLLGAAFGFFCLLPFTLRVSEVYSTWMGFSAIWRLGGYAVCKFALSVGVGFEMPVIILLLLKRGLVTAHRLVLFRKYMLVINLVLGVALSGPEVFTQVLVAVPLQMLYEVSIVLALRLEKRNMMTAEPASS